MFCLGTSHFVTLEGKELRFSWPPLNLCMYQHYSNAFTEKTMSSNTKSVLGSVSVAPFHTPFILLLLTEKERERKLEGA